MSIDQRNEGDLILQRAVGHLGGDYRGLCIAELGCQIMKFRHNQSNQYRSIPAKLVFEMLGAVHVSFDQNGKYGSLQCDLRRAIRSSWLQRHTGLTLGSFDLVTNFGTLEHVRNRQAVVFANMHNLCRTSGLIVHEMPMSGTCRGHGNWKYTAQWLRELAAAQGYRIVYLATHDRHLGWAQIPAGAQVYVRAIFEKTIKEWDSSRFVDPSREKPGE